MSTRIASTVLMSTGQGSTIIRPTGILPTGICSTNDTNLKRQPPLGSTELGLMSIRY